MERLQEQKQQEKQSPWHILLNPRYANCKPKLSHQQLREKYLPVLNRNQPTLDDDFKEWIDRWPYERPARLEWTIDPMTGEIGDLKELYDPVESTDLDFDQLVAGKMLEFFL